MAEISGCVFRSCFACLWSCSFVRLLKISGCVFSVSFFFLRLCLSFLFLFSFSVCGFLCQAVVLFFLFSSFFRLWFWFCFLVLCPLLLSGYVLLSCVFCLCQVVLVELPVFFSFGRGLLQFSGCAFGFLPFVFSCCV